MKKTKKTCYFFKPMIIAVIVIVSVIPYQLVTANYKSEDQSSVDVSTFHPFSADTIQKSEKRNILDGDLSIPFQGDMYENMGTQEALFGVSSFINPTIHTNILDKNNIEDLEIHLKTYRFDPLIEEPDIPDELKLIKSNGYFIIQCIGPIESEWINDLQYRGVEILEYIPNYAYIVHMADSIKNSIEQLSFIRWVGLFHPGYKIDPNINTKEESIELNVVIFQGNAGSRNLGVVTNRIREKDGIITYNGADNFVIRVKISTEKIQDIALFPEVKWISKYTHPMTFMDNTRVFTGASIAHTLGFDGSGIIGEVKDGGFDQNHPDFIGQIQGLEGNIEDAAHGTCTFGTVFSSGEHDSTAKGLLPNGKGVFCSYMKSRTTSMNNLDTYWGGVFQSNSWGYAPFFGLYDADSQEDDQCVFDHDNIVMLYAGGNSNSGVYPSSLTGDAVAKNIISVGGLHHFDDSDRENDEWVDNGQGFTPSQGPASDGRIKPDLCGPFDYGYVTDSVDGDGEDGYCPGNYCSTFGGTSFATPVVAGCTGIVYEMYKEDFFGNNPTGNMPHASTVKALLIANAHQYNLDTQANRYQQGWGLPDLEKISDIGEKHFIIDENYPIRVGQSLSFSFQRQQGYPLKISMVWTDPSGSPLATSALVNDLNLKVTSPSGYVYWGNYGLENSQWSTAGGTGDNLNNVENVFVQYPEAGEWIIEVIAENIAIDGHPETPFVFDQDFALVATAQASPVLDESTMCDWAGPHCDHGVFRPYFNVGEECWFYGHITNTNQGDTLQVRWKKEGVTVFTTNEWSIPEPWSSVCFWSGYTPSYPSLQWQVEVLFNGVPIGNGPVFHMYDASVQSHGEIPFSTFYDELYDEEGSHKRYSPGEDVDVSIYGKNIGGTTRDFKLEMWIDNEVVASIQDTLSPGEIIFLDRPGIIEDIQEDVDCRAEIHYWYSDGGYWVLHDEKHITIEIEPIIIDAFIDFDTSVFYEGPFLPGFLETVASVTLVNIGSSDYSFAVQLMEYPDTGDEQSVSFLVTPAILPGESYTLDFVVDLPGFEGQWPLGIRVYNTICPLWGDPLRTNQWTVSLEHVLDAVIDDENSTFFQGPFPFDTTQIVASATILNVGSLPSEFIVEFVENPDVGGETILMEQVSPMLFPGETYSFDFEVFMLRSCFSFYLGLRVCTSTCPSWDDEERTHQWMVYIDHIYDGIIDYENSSFYEGPFLPESHQTVASVHVVNNGTYFHSYCIELVEYPGTADEHSLLFLPTESLAPGASELMNFEVDLPSITCEWPLGVRVYTTYTPLWDDQERTNKWMIVIDACPWDVNGDGIVSPQDVALVKYHYGCDPSIPEYAMYDVNHDGEINPQDVGLIKYQYGPCTECS